MKPTPFKSLREEGLYNILLKTIVELEHLGYACVVWKPDELKGVDPAKLINATIEHGWEYIATFTEEPDPYDPDDTTINHPYLGTIIQRTPSNQENSIPMTPLPIKLIASETYLISIDPTPTPAQALGVPEDGPTMSLIHQWIDTKVSEAIKDLKCDLKEEVERFNYVELADNVDLSDLASHIDAEELASRIETSDVAASIAPENIAKEIDLAELAEHINYHSLARAIGTLMGWDCKKEKPNA